MTTNEEEYQVSEAGKLIIKELMDLRAENKKLKENADFDCKEYHRLRKEVQAENQKLKEKLNEERKYNRKLKNIIEHYQENLDLTEMKNVVNDLNNQNNNDECNCKFNSKEDDGGESWHYVRKCEFCGYSWHGLHCPHDGYQNPCPECKKTPIIK